MVSVLSLNQRLYIKLVFVASLLSTHHQGERAKTSCLGIRIICLERYVYLRTVVSVRYHYNDPIKHVSPVQSGHHHHFTEVTCSPHDTAEIFLFNIKQHSLTLLT
jgi:hypothetical protein